MMMKAASVSLAVLLLVGVAPATAQSSSASQPCPPVATTGQGDPSKSAAPAEQGVEHSAILPNATGHNESAAATVKQNGEDVIAQTECPKPANRLDSGKPSGAQ